MAALRAGSRCDVVFGTQRYEKVGAASDAPCTDQLVEHRLHPRVKMQALSVGRSYEWARATLPPPRYFVRTRLDAFWCLPSAPTLRPFGPRIVVVGDFRLFTDMASARHTVDEAAFSPIDSFALPAGAVPIASDRYAVVPAGVAEAYFGQWRLWSALSCDHPRLLGPSRARELCTAWPAVLCHPSKAGSEAVLSLQLLSATAMPTERAPPPGLVWMSMARCGDCGKVIRQVNATHAHTNGLAAGGGVGAPTGHLSYGALATEFTRIVRSSHCVPEFRPTQYCRVNRSEGIHAAHHCEQ